MKSYFNVLESVNLGTDINPKIALYHSVWDKINSANFGYNQSCWEPESEEERALLRGFKINYEDTPMHLAFCLDLNSVEVKNVYEVASDFEEFAEKRLKEFFDYAYPIFLEQHHPVEKRNRKTA